MDVDAIIFMLLPVGVVLVLLSILINKIWKSDIALHLMAIGLLCFPTAAAAYYIPGSIVIKCIVIAVGAIIAVLACLRIAGKI